MTVFWIYENVYDALSRIFEDQLPLTVNINLGNQYDNFWGIQLKISQFQPQKNIQARIFELVQ